MAKRNLPVMTGLVFGAICSCPAVSSAEQANSHPGVIRGIVTDAETGKAIANAYVGVGEFGDSGGSNRSRHREEGFNLCDGIHCQAYKGRHVWSEDVEIGAEVTDGLVICDRDTVLINPVFHSNSGGETRGAEKVWLKGESYLKPVLDPFSLGQRNSTWERNMHVRDWLMYLLSYEIRFPANGDTSALQLRISFTILDAVALSHTWP